MKKNKISWFRRVYERRRAGVGPSCDYPVATANQIDLPKLFHARRRRFPKTLPSPPSSQQRRHDGDNANVFQLLLLAGLPLQPQTRRSRSVRSQVEPSGTWASSSVSSSSHRRGGEFSDSTSPATDKAFRSGRSSVVIGRTWLLHGDYSAAKNAAKGRKARQWEWKCKGCCRNFCSCIVTSPISPT